MQGLPAHTTWSSVQENHRCSLVVVHFGVILGDSPIIALSDVGNSRLLAVVAVIARDILANMAQEQAHVFRATMMQPTGCLTGVPCCAGSGSRGTKPWHHPTASPPRGPSAGHRRPSRPFGLRSLTQPKEQELPQKGTFFSIKGYLHLNECIFHSDKETKCIYPNSPYKIFEASKM